ncbi:hypothetical protein BV898_06926 [Hypsibius exemplaris]|uniref:Uncharacterized protein n=1 Tax=Hypsibius exemplaris TaxID=2072580 RepID=A0A1W0WV53_HYPEX|nr:hypothetical protein BV898_06926 [Hypsibius exemplaris]
MEKFYPSRELIQEVEMCGPYGEKSAFRVRNIKRTSEIEDHPEVRLPRDLAVLSSMVNKRHCWTRTLTTLRHVLAETGDSIATDQSNNQSRGVRAVTCIIRRIPNWNLDVLRHTYHRQANWQMCRNVLCVSSTLFPAHSRTVWTRATASGKKNRVSSLLALTERALRPESPEEPQDPTDKPEAKQPMRGSSRIVKFQRSPRRAKVSSRAAQLVRAMQRGIVHEVGVVTRFPYPRWFPKTERPVTGTSRSRMSGGTKQRARNLEVDHDFYLAESDWTDEEDCEEIEPQDEEPKWRATEWTFEELMKVSEARRAEREEKHSSRRTPGQRGKISNSSSFVSAIEESSFDFCSSALSSDFESVE